MVKQKQKQNKTTSKLIYFVTTHFQLDPVILSNSYNEGTNFQEFLFEISCNGKGKNLDMKRTNNCDWS